MVTHRWYLHIINRNTRICLLQHLSSRMRTITVIKHHKQPKAVKASCTNKTLTSAVVFFSTSPITNSNFLDITKSIVYIIATTSSLQSKQGFATAKRSLWRSRLVFECLKPKQIQGHLLRQWCWGLRDHTRDGWETPRVDGDPSWTQAQNNETH